MRGPPSTPLLRASRSALRAAEAKRPRRVPVRLCATHAARVGDKYLILTEAYYETREKATKAIDLEALPLTLE